MITVIQKDNTININGKLFQVDSYISASNPSGNLVAISASGQGIVIQAPYDLYQNSNSQPFGANPGQVVTALNAIFQNSNPGGLIKNTDKITALAEVENFTTSSAGYILTASNTADGGILIKPLQDLLSTGDNVLTSVIFDLDEPDQLSDGRLAYDADKDTLVFQSEHGEITIGETYKPVYNGTGSTISKGTVLKATGVQGERFTVGLFDASSGVDDELYLIGIAQADIPDQTEGVVVSEGYVKHLDTSTYSVGTILYASETAGAFTSTKPSSPNLGIPVAMVTKVDSTNGTIYVRLTQYSHLTEAHDVNISSPSNGEVLTYNSTSGVWENAAAAGGGGISDIIEDTTPQLGGNLDLNSNDITGTGDISIVGTIISTGSISTLGSMQAAGNISAVDGTFTGNAYFNGTLSAGTAILSGIQFTGGGTTSIGIATGLPNQPADLQITSNGNVTVQLDADDDESSQHFKVLGSDGTTLFQVDEDGITAGLLTTASPTTSGVLTAYQQTASLTGTVSNFDQSATYVAAIYDSSGVELTSNPVTVDSSGNITGNAPTTVATGYELRVSASGAGKLRSVQSVNTFEVTASRTFTHWRFKVFHNDTTNRSNYIMALNLDLYSGSNATGTKYPDTLTSATSQSDLTVTWGYSYPGREFWKLFDFNETGTDWWTISNPVPGNQQWGQLEFDTAITLASIKLTYNGQFTTANQFRVFGSNTGAFAGEEVDCGTFSLSAGVSGTFTEILNI